MATAAATQGLRLRLRCCWAAGPPAAGYAVFKQGPVVEGSMLPGMLPGIGVCKSGWLVSGPHAGFADQGLVLAEQTTPGSPPQRLRALPPVRSNLIEGERVCSCRRRTPDSICSACAGHDLQGQHR